MIGVAVRVSDALSGQHYALTKGREVVWDSVTRQPPEPPHPSAWDGVLVSAEAFEKAAGGIEMSDEVSPDFKRLVDAVIAIGHTCESVLRRLDGRLATTPAGPGRDNLLAFRAQLAGKIADARDVSL